MVRARSPSYPSMSLEDAIQRVHKIYQSDRLNPIDREAAAVLIGYKGSSGASDKSLAALSHYGLVERFSKGELRVTSLAVDILYPDPPEARAQALQEAFRSPDLFQKLADRFPDVPSTGALKGYLRREGFVESAINQVASSYLESCSYLKRESAYDDSSSSDVHVAESGAETVPEIASSPPNKRPNETQRISITSGERVLLSGLMSKTSNFRLLVDGPVTVKEIERLIAKLEMDKDILADDEREEFTAPDQNGRE